MPTSTPAYPPENTIRMATAIRCHMLKLETVIGLYGETTSISDGGGTIEAHTSHGSGFSRVISVKSKIADDAAK